MTLTDIRVKLVNLAIGIERYNYDIISEELMVIADNIHDIENDVIGTIAGLSQALKDYERRNHTEQSFY